MVHSFLNFYYNITLLKNENLCVRARYKVGKIADKLFINCFSPFNAALVVLRRVP